MKKSLRTQADTDAAARALAPFVDHRTVLKCEKDETPETEAADFGMVSAPSNLTRILDVLTRGVVDEVIQQEDTQEWDERALDSTRALSSSNLPAQQHNDGSTVRLQKKESGAKLADSGAKAARHAVLKDLVAAIADREWNAGTTKLPDAPAPTVTLPPQWESLVTCIVEEVSHRLAGLPVVSAPVSDKPSVGEAGCARPETVPCGRRRKQLDINSAKLVKLRAQIASYDAACEHLHPRDIRALLTRVEQLEEENEYLYRRAVFIDAVMGRSATQRSSVAPAAPTPQDQPARMSVSMLPAVRQLRSENRAQQVLIARLEAQLMAERDYDCRRCALPRASRTDTATDPISPEEMEAAVSCADSGAFADSCQVMDLDMPPLPEAPPPDADEETIEQYKILLEIAQVERRKRMADMIENGARAVQVQISEAVCAHFDNLERTVGGLASTQAAANQAKHATVSAKEMVLGIVQSVLTEKKAIVGKWRQLSKVRSRSSSVAVTPCDMPLSTARATPIPEITGTPRPSDAAARASRFSSFVPPGTTDAADARTSQPLIQNAPLSQLESLQVVPVVEVGKPAPAEAPACDNAQVTTAPQIESSSIAPPNKTDQVPPSAPTVQHADRTAPKTDDWARTNEAASRASRLPPPLAEAPLAPVRLKSLSVDVGTSAMVEAIDRAIGCCLVISDEPAVATQTSAGARPHNVLQPKMMDNGGREDGQPAMGSHQPSRPGHSLFGGRGVVKGAGTKVMGAPQRKGEQSQSPSVERPSQNEARQPSLASPSNRKQQPVENSQNPVSGFAHIEGERLKEAIQWAVRSGEATEVLRQKRVKANFHIVAAALVSQASNSTKSPFDPKVGNFFERAARIKQVWLRRRQVLQAQIKAVAEVLYQQLTFSLYGASHTVRVRHPTLRHVLALAAVEADDELPAIDSTTTPGEKPTTKAIIKPRRADVGLPAVQPLEVSPKPVIAAELKDTHLASDDSVSRRPITVPASSEFWFQPRVRLPPTDNSNTLEEPSDRRGATSHLPRRKDKEAYEKDAMLLHTVDPPPSGSKSVGLRLATQKLHAVERAAIADEMTVLQKVAMARAQTSQGTSRPRGRHAFFNSMPPVSSSAVPLAGIETKAALNEAIKLYLQQP